MLNRLSHFFSLKRKKSSSKRRSDSDSSVSSPPLSPCSLQSEEEEELSTPTLSRKECDISVPPLAYAATDPEHFETLSQSSGHSTSSAVSIVTRNEDFTNITPRTLDLAITPCLDLRPEKGFPESGVQDKCQQSSVDQSSTEGSTEDKTVTQTALSEAKVPLSDVIATPVVPKSPDWNASVSKNTGNSGENQDNFNRKEAVFPSSALDLAQQVNEKCPDTQRENAGTKEPELSHSCKQEHAPGTNCPLCPPQRHKAIRVETYLRGEDKDREEGDNLKSIAKDWQEGLQEDMPLVLAIPVTVISEDSDTQSTTDSPSDPLSSMECLQRPGSSQDSHTSLLQTSGSSTREESKPSTLQEKHASGEVCVTRKTVNLPSKHKAMPHKVRGNQVQSLAREKPAKQESKELPSKNAKTTTLQL